jgi:hypothetical protein
MHEMDRSFSDFRVIFVPFSPRTPVAAAGPHLPIGRYAVNRYQCRLIALPDLRSYVLGKLTPRHRLLPIASTRHGRQILKTGLRPWPT